MTHPPLQCGGGADQSTKPEDLLSQNEEAMGRNESPTQNEEEILDDVTKGDSSNSDKVCP